DFEPASHPPESFYGGHTHFAIALGHVAISHRELCPFHVHRVVELRSFGELLDVSVPAHPAADVRGDGAIHAFSKRSDPVHTHERRDRNSGFPPCVFADETREPSVLAFVDRKSTRLNSSHVSISYAVFCLKKKKII